MPLKVLNGVGQLIGIGSANAVLMIFGITFSPLVYRPRVPSGGAAEHIEPEDKEAHEAHGQESGGEHVRADGYIDSFAGLVEEAGGSLPLIVSVFTIGLLIWWAAYLVIEWSEPFAPLRIFWR